ncbi:MAG: hypothetical protein ACI9UA_005905, partial [Pseudoalteromonas tetraodonis]
MSDTNFAPPLTNAGALRVSLPGERSENTSVFQSEPEAVPLLIHSFQHPDGG